MTPLQYWNGARDKGIDVLVLNKILPLRRPLRESIHGRTFWKPFFVFRQPLIAIRQVGHLRLGPLPDNHLLPARAALIQALGPPEYEDDLIVVFSRVNSNRAN